MSVELGPWLRGNGSVWSLTTKMVGGSCWFQLKYQNEGVSFLGDPRKKESVVFSLLCFLCLGVNK